ncbi:Hsp70 family protein [Actinomyces bowdenii]|uniref:Hsp70 family protein n=1 Tax=Actinomyces bowdenii TaxID=131109 RepID=A0A853EHK1_9ACTO|nr:Hsp70 family protein [Actinomyces bowdenii]MBF0696461.1 Hsp70 family protein [Actinomyces bowdenii]NYS68634.1 Hsp70 family protein [Actinomyces bowdenii]
MAADDSGTLLSSTRDTDTDTDLGIDLGTTRTVVARADRGNYPVLGFTDEHGDDHDFLPSLTALHEGVLVHGFEARRAARQGAPLLRSLKRLLASPTITASTPVSLGEQTFSVLEILTDFLRHLRTRLEEAQVDVSRSRVVVAVPAHAYGAQRLLTLEAFKAAGFHVAAMLNEPSAAGFEYTHRKATTVSSRRTRVLVYDLGGGTFDTSLVDVVGTSHEVIASYGLGDLGGDDVDLLAASMVLQRAGIAEEDLEAAELDELLEQCRDAKERLTPQSRRLVVVLRGQDIILPVADLYEACTPLVERSLTTMAPLVGRLEDGTPDLTEIAGVYLVGGASGLPLVPRLLRERFGRRVHRSPYPGASTAIGLAIAADRTAAYDLTDRLSRGFGVFREADAGQRLVFDAILSPDSIQASPDGREGTVLTREYDAAHNVAWFRYVECAGVDHCGEPRGELAPYQDIVFPLETHLREVEDLDQVVVERRDRGPRIREHYRIDETGLVRVTITDLTDDYTRQYVLGHRTA